MLSISDVESWKRSIGWDPRSGRREKYGWGWRCSTLARVIRVRGGREQIDDGSSAVMLRLGDTAPMRKSPHPSPTQAVDTNARTANMAQPTSLDFERGKVTPIVPRQLYPWERAVRARGFLSQGQRQRRAT